MDEATIQRLLDLSQLALSEEEKERLKSDLDAIIGFIEVMDAVPTEGVSALSHAVDLQHRLRPDVPDIEVDRDAFQAIAPQTEDGFYLVPKVLEQR